MSHPDVFGNVFLFGDETPQGSNNVFGNTFNWRADIADAPAFGWEIRTLERVWYPEERVVLFEVRPVERVWVLHEQR